MSRVVRVAGSLRTVRDTLSRIRAQMAMRDAIGWSQFLADEYWEYRSQRDEKVCPICEANDLDHLFIGDEISTKFPSNTYREKPKEVHPQVHIDNPWLKGECRCSLFWMNFPEILYDRLHEELLRETLG